MRGFTEDQIKNIKALNRKYALKAFGMIAKCFGLLLLANFLVCSASGGYPPYSYLWQGIGTAPQISIVSGASSNTVIIQNTYLTVGFTQGFTCTVTDSLGNKSVSNTLSVTTV